MATLPSIKTSTGLVMALTTRSDGLPVVQHVGRVVSLPQAAATASVANEARAGMRIERNIPHGRATVPKRSAVSRAPSFSSFSRFVPARPIDLRDR